MSIIGKLDAEIKVNNVPKALDELDAAVIAALEAVGGQAEGDVALLAPTDTSLLKNSITHAIEGGPPAIGSYKGDNPPKKNPSAGIPSGSYSGTASGNAQKPRSVFVGTNVKYAVYQEMGTSRHAAANHGKGFLRFAIQNNLSKYVGIIKKQLETDQGV